MHLRTVINYIRSFIHLQFETENLLHLIKKKVCLNFYCYEYDFRDNFSKMRHLLQRGIETVRLLGSHGMSVNLVVHIARSLEAKTNEFKQMGLQFSSQADETENRTVYYWQQALDMLERLEK